MITGIQNADPQASKFGRDPLIYVAIFRKHYVRISGIGQVFTQYLPTTAFAAGCIVGSHKLPHSGAASVLVGYSET